MHLDLCLSLTLVPRDSSKLRVLLAASVPSTSSTTVTCITKSIAMRFILAAFLKREVMMPPAAASPPPPPPFFPSRPLKLRLAAAFAPAVYDVDFLGALPPTPADPLDLETASSCTPLPPSLSLPRDNDVRVFVCCLECSAPTKNAACCLANRQQLASPLLLCKALAGRGTFSGLMRWVAAVLCVLCPLYAMGATGDAAAAAAAVVASGVSRRP